MPCPINVPPVKIAHSPLKYLESSCKPDEFPISITDLNSDEVDEGNLVLIEDDLNIGIKSLYNYPF